MTWAVVVWVPQGDGGWVLWAMKKDCHVYDTDSWSTFWCMLYEVRE